MFDSYAYSFKYITLEKYIILINDSNDSNQSSKFTDTVVVALKKKRKKKKTKTVSRANIQPLTEYCSVRMRIKRSFKILIKIESFRIEIKNIMGIVKYEYDKYFKL